MTLKIDTMNLSQNDLEIRSNECQNDLESRYSEFKSKDPENI
jgi:hypothetical protein